MKKNENKRETKPTSLPLAKLRNAAWNTHRASGKDDEAYLGLIDSLKANGMMHRVAVRPVGGAEADGQDAYEILDGHRRVEAARALGWKEVPCEVYPEMDAAEAHALTLTANLQRLENDPLLEAACIQQMADAGKDWGKIAAALGKDARYVARRARLCSLTPEWRGWFAKVEGVEVDLMEFVARHETSLQDEVYRDYIEKDGGDGVYEDDVRRAFDSRLMSLEDAAFNTADAGCAKCPCNTGNHGWLFPNWDSVGGRCQKAECYRRHWNGAVDEQIARLRKKGVKVLEVSAKWNIPNHWDVTPCRERKNTQPWVYEEDGLKRLVWGQPKSAEKARGKAKEAMTEPEKAGEKAFKARVKAWRESRDRVAQAFTRTPKAILRSMVMKATEGQAFRDWGVAALAEPYFWGPQSLKNFLSVVGRDAAKAAMPLDDADVDALYADEPTRDDGTGDDTETSDND